MSISSAMGGGDMGSEITHPAGHARLFTYRYLTEDSRAEQRAGYMFVFFVCFFAVKFFLIPTIEVVVCLSDALTCGLEKDPYQ